MSEDETPIIIHVRGTSGSGKSHLARRVMERYEAHDDISLEGRKRPIATLHTSADPETRKLFVPGHYETDCGGADTIPAMDLIQELVLSAWVEGKNVLFEGLLSTPEFNRTLALHKTTGGRVHVIFLSTDIETCVASVNARRVEKAKRSGKTEAPPPLNPKNTISKYKQADSARKKLEAAGIPCEVLDREAAYKRVCQLLGV